MGKTSKGAVDPKMLEHPHNLTQELPDFCKVKILVESDCNMHGLKLLKSKGVFLKRS